MGEHRESDAAFERAFMDGMVHWERKIVEPPKIF